LGGDASRSSDKVEGMNENGESGSNAETPDSNRLGENVMERGQKEADIGVCREITPGVYCMDTGKGIMRSGSSWVLIDAASKQYL
jgi:hypothetical protein